MIRGILFLIALLALGGSYEKSFAANGQIVPSGSFAVGHTVRCQNSTCTVVIDAGGSNGSSTSGVGYLTELGITNTGTPLCVTDALTTLPYHQLCFGANALGGGLISYNAYNGASPLPLYENLNGTTYTIPSSGAGSGNVTGPASSTNGDFAVFNGTNGALLKDGGVPGTAAFVNTGTSGATLGLLNANKTDSGNNIYSGTEKFTGNVGLTNGYLWADANAAGCTADSSTDRTSCVANLFTAGDALFGAITVLIPSSNGAALCLTTGLTLHNAGDSIVGTHRNLSILAACGGNSAPTITRAAGYQHLDNLTILGKGAPGDPNDNTFGASHPVVYDEAGDDELNNITIFGGLYNVQNVATTSITDFNNFQGGFGYGGSVDINGNAFLDGPNSFDQPWPYAQPAGASLASISAWAGTTSYTVGNIRTFASGGLIGQVTACAGTCTSGSSEPTLANYGSTVVDNPGANQVTWAFATCSVCVAMTLDTTAQEVKGNGSIIDLTGAQSDGLLIKGCTECTLSDVLASQTINSPIAVEGGAEIILTEAVTGQAVLQGASGVIATSAFTGTLTINGGYLTADYGLSWQAGSGGTLAVAGTAIAGINQYALYLGATAFALTGNTLIAGTNGCGNIIASTYHGSVYANHCTGSVWTGTPGANVLGFTAATNP